MSVLSLDSLKSPLQVPVHNKLEQSSMAHSLLSCVVIVMVMKLSTSLPDSTKVKSTSVAEIEEYLVGYA